LPELDEVQSIQRRQANTTFDLNDIQFDVMWAQCLIAKHYIFSPLEPVSGS